MIVSFEYILAAIRHFAQYFYCRMSFCVLVTVIAQNEKEIYIRHRIINFINGQTGIMNAEIIPVSMHCRCQYI